MFSLARALASAKNHLGQIPSSQGELTVQLLTRTFRQQSISNPSRLVSTSTLSIVRLSTPVASSANHPPCSTEKSRSSTLWQFFKAIALIHPPGRSDNGRSGSELAPRLRPFPQISPLPKIAMSCRPSPHIRLLRQWLWP